MYIFRQQKATGLVVVCILFTTLQKWHLKKASNSTTVPKFPLSGLAPGKTKMPRRQRSLLPSRQDIATSTRQDGRYWTLQFGAPDVADDNDISYGTEPAVGKAIKYSGVPRDQIFVTSKLWNNKHHPADVGQALQDTLNDLGLEHIDLFLMHWPVAFRPGDDMFPSDERGKLITADIDYVDVSAVPSTCMYCIADFSPQDL